MSLSFRPGTEADVDTVALLASHSFPTVASSLDEWRDYLLRSGHGGIETLWVGEEDGRIVGACRCYDFQQWIGGVRFPVMGLGLVINAVTDRRRGIAGQLVRSALERSAAQGRDGSLLYPFRVSFYQKLGYGLAGTALQHRVACSDLPDHPSRSGVRLVQSDEDRADCARLYAEWAPGQNGQIDRRPGLWERVWDKGKSLGVLFRGADGKPRGYLVFTYQLDSPRGQRTVDVTECVWLDNEARLALYAWLGSLSDQWNYVLLRTHPDEQFAQLLGEPRYGSETLGAWRLWFPEAVQLGGPMFRLLNMEAWSRRPVATGGRLTVQFSVEDVSIAAMAGDHTIEFDSGEARVSHSASSNSDLSIRLPVDVLSRLFIGSLRPTDAHRNGLLETATPGRLAELDQLLHLRSPWTFERF